MITAVLMAIGTIVATEAAASQPLAPLAPEWMPLCTLVFGGLTTALIYAQVVVFVGTAQGVLDLTDARDDEIAASKALTAQNDELKALTAQNAASIECFRRASLSPEERAAEDAEAERKRLEAEAEAERKRLEAEAEAERKRLEAEAIRERLREAERKRLEAEAEAERKRLEAEAGGQS